MRVQEIYTVRQTNQRLPRIVTWFRNWPITARCQHIRKMAWSVLWLSRDSDLWSVQIRKNWHNPYFFNEVTKLTNLWDRNVEFLWHLWRYWTVVTLERCFCLTCSFIGLHIVLGQTKNCYRNTRSGRGTFSPFSIINSMLTCSITNGTSNIEQGSFPTTRSTSYLTYSQWKRLCQNCSNPQLWTRNGSETLKSPIDFDAPFQFKELCDKLEELV